MESFTLTSSTSHLAIILWNIDIATMKILILTNNLIGLFSFRKEVVEALKNLGYEVVISAPVDTKKEYFEQIGCKLIDTQFDRKGMNPIKDLGLMLFYRRLIKTERANVVLSYTIKPNLYGGMACQLCKVPQIANITGLGTAVENPGVLQKLTILLYKVGLQKTQIVFFQNKANEEFCDKHNMVKGRTILLPGSGVNLQYHAYKEYPPKEEPIRFIFISRLMREKGIEEYLSAAEIIKERHPSTEFYILGACEDDYEKRVVELQKKGIVNYFGLQPDVRPYIEKIHCTVHPSFYPEGMSNVLLESCATGRPIITTNRPGCGEIVEDGHNGYVVKAKNVDDLVNAIEKFLQLPYEQKRMMGIEGRRKVEREFDRNIVVDAYLRAVRENEKDV